MMNLFTCCMPRRKKMVAENFSEFGNFERFSQNKISLRREKLKTRNITGMSKFRASQKLKRKMENMQCKTMPKPKMEKNKKKISEKTTPTFTLPANFDCLKLCAL